MAVLDSTRIYITLPWLYFTLLDSTLVNHRSTSLYYTLHYYTMPPLHTNGLYVTLTCLYFTVLDSTLPYHGTTLLYYTLHSPTMAVLHFT